MGEKCADLHLHTNESFDGCLNILEILDLAKENNTNLISITNHNTYGVLQSFWKAHNFDFDSPIETLNNIAIVPAVEVTCRVRDCRNRANNTAKVHLIVYGADMSPDSPLSKLLEIKRKNDRECDLGLLDYFLEVKGKGLISDKQAREFIIEKRKENTGFSSLSKESIWELFAKHGITVAKSYQEFTKLCSLAPRYERLDIFADDLIEIAHASNGHGVKHKPIVVMAHPWVSLKRVDDKMALLSILLKYNIDGFELYSSSSNDDTFSMIKRAVKKHKGKSKIIYTGGSDLHDMSRGNQVGRVSYQELPRIAVYDFEKKIYSIAEDRIKNRTDSLPYLYSDKDRIVELLKYYYECYEYIQTCVNTDLNVDAKKVKRPKVKEKRNSKNERKARAEKKGLDPGVKYDIEDFESVHAYLEALRQKEEEIVEEQRSLAEQIEYEKYLEQQRLKYSVNVTGLLEGYKYIDEIVKDNNEKE